MAMAAIWFPVIELCPVSGYMSSPRFGVDPVSEWTPIRFPEIVQRVKRGMAAAESEQLTKELKLLAEAGKHDERNARIDALVRTLPEAFLVVVGP